ncbi:ABC transporter ATP-binding protein [Cognatishimia sp. SS12]|uniref:ABC transporter ATP-binding protein n=1 Tax=Cognatishimia sp. SS12 TaxID=2979465 RepID=UPI00232C091B|nr:ABC transporter ATP-binding protein [Cognatishimia sp. SS12]MDC0738320.1 ABC transporter ATP-binding protein [Cognatishimia sp. SS12]
MLSLKNISTTHRKRPLCNLSAELESGKIYTILGRTGAGKTELLRIVMGLDDIADGHLELDGQNLADRPVRLRQMSMVYQQFINYPHLTVVQNVAFPLRRQGFSRADAHDRAMAALALVGLAGFEHRMPPELSGGQQQRVAIARAIVKKARILLMDEPLANLDYKLREKLREEFPRLLAENADGIILYSTTEPAEAMQLGHEMIVMHEGCILAMGAPADIFENPATVEVAKLVSDPPVSICHGEIANGQLMLAGTALPEGAGLVLKGDGPIQVGIRPDALSIGGDMPAKVVLAEFSGSDTIVHLSLEFGAAVMLLEGIHEFKTDQSIQVSLDTSTLLLFSAEGKNITERRSNG